MSIAEIRQYDNELWIVREEGLMFSASTCYNGIKLDVEFNTRVALKQPFIYDLAGFVTYGVEYCSDYLKTVRHGSKGGVFL